MSLRILLTGRSDRHSRPSNQDRLYPTEEKLPASLDLPQYLAVADGMGGTQNGEFAAQIAVQDLPHLMHPERWSVLQAGPQQPPPSAEEQSPEASIESYFRYINQRIMQSAGGSGHSGTTLSLLYLENEHFWIGHIGDSRVYLYRQQTLTRLTRDDHALDYFEEKGSITLDPKQLKLSEEDHQYLEEQKLSTHKLLYLPDQPPATPLNSDALEKQLRGQVQRLHQLGKLSPLEDLQDRLMRALGSEKAFLERPILQAIPGTTQAIPKPGDLFLLCTDGLWGSLSDEAISERFRQLLRRSKTAHLDPALLTWCCDQLIEDAIQAGADDNISILLGQILPSRSAPHTLSVENYPKDLKKILDTQFKSSGNDEDTEDIFQQPTVFDPVLIEEDTVDFFQQPTSFESTPAKAQDFRPKPPQKEESLPKPPLSKPKEVSENSSRTIEDIPSLPTPPKLSPPRLSLPQAEDLSKAVSPKEEKEDDPKETLANDAFAKTIQDGERSPILPLLHPPERPRSSAGTSFSTHTPLPANAPSSKPLPTQERFLWIGVSGTLFLLCLIAWLGVPSTRSTQPKPVPTLTPRTPQNPPKRETPKPTPRPLPPSGPWTWLPTQLKKPIASSALLSRLRLIQQLHHLHQDFAQRWGLAPETLRSLSKTLQKKQISAASFQRFSLRPPTPPQLQELDRVLQHAVVMSLTALAPSYTQKLDQMRTPPPLPRSAPRFPWSINQRKAFRQELLQKWLKRTQHLGWQLWQLELLAEQLLDFPYPPPKALQKGPWIPKDLDAIRRTTERLTKALSILQKEAPKHPLIPDLQNRLQIQQAWFKEAPNKEKP